MCGGICSGLFAGIFPFGMLIFPLFFLFFAGIMFFVFRRILFHFFGSTQLQGLNNMHKQTDELIILRQELAELREDLKRQEAFKKS